MSCPQKGIPPHLYILFPKIYRLVIFMSRCQKLPPFLPLCFGHKNLYPILIFICFVNKLHPLYLYVLFSKIGLLRIFMCCPQNVYTSSTSLYDVLKNLPDSHYCVVHKNLHPSPV